MIIWTDNSTSEHFAGDIDFKFPKKYFTEQDYEEQFAVILFRLERLLNVTFF